MSPRTALESLARFTYGLLGLSAARSIRLDEDAITSVILLSLDQAFAGRPVAVADVRKYEARWGADLQLFLECEPGTWNQFLLQAKKMSNVGRYDRLAHMVGGRRQIDVLRAHAVATNAIPAYLLYNGPHGIPNPGLSFWQCCLPLDSLQYGCTVAPLNSIEAALRRRPAIPRTFRALHGQTVAYPWRCLYCPRTPLACEGPLVPVGADLVQTEDLPEHVRQLLLRRLEVDEAGRMFEVEVPPVQIHLKDEPEILEVVPRFVVAIPR